jgi:hypothetical protein
MTATKTKATTATANPARSFQVSQATQAAVNRAFSPGAPVHYTPAEPLPEVPPDTLPRVGRHKACAAILEQFCGYPRLLLRNPRLAPEWRKRLNEIRRIAYESQQPTPPPEIDHQALAAARGDLICNGERRRFAESAELRALLANDFDGIPIAPEREVVEALMVYLTTDGLEPARTLRKRLAEYQIRLNDAFQYLSPTLRADERRVALNSPGLTDEGMKTIVAEGHLSKSEHFPQIRGKTIAEANQFWDTNIRPLEKQMIQGAIAFAKQCRESWVRGEQEFYAEAGMPHDGRTAKTEPARRFDSTIEALSQALDSLNRSHGGPLSDAIGHSVLSRIYGVTSLT